MKCRHCKEKIEKVFIDLGEMPPSNSYLTNESKDDVEKRYPLKVFVCENCFLVQTKDFVDREEMFSNEYCYFSSMSKSFLEHAKSYVDMIIERLSLDDKSKVLEIACNDGYLLQYFVEKKIPCMGIEPTKSTAKKALEKGIMVIMDFFGEKLSEKLKDKAGTFDLIIGNNVLAHVPDINDFLYGVFNVLSYTGTATFEFPYLINLIKNNQFDTIYHEHFSYFSVTTIERIFEANGLEVYDIEEISTHGGSLRIYAQLKVSQNNKRKKSVEDFLNKEKDLGLKTIEFYERFQGDIESIKEEFNLFKRYCKDNKLKIIGYGAAAKANTFLNYIGADLSVIPFVIDTTPAKQGKFLPGSKIPIYSEEKFKEIDPDYIIIFPWNFKDEIIKRLREMKLVKETCLFVTFIPEMEIYK